MIGADDVAAFEREIEQGGVVVFPTDTLYGIGCDAENEAARERVYALKGRPRERPSAIMYFSPESAFAALRDVGPRTLEALRALFPGPVLAVLADGGGVRVPLLEGELSPLARAHVAVLQTSANLTGGPNPRRLADVPASLRDGADLVIDGGELPGEPSTVVDLRGYEETGDWSVLREGAVDSAALASLLGG